MRRTALALSTMELLGMDAATLAAIDEGTMSSRALVFDGSGRPRAARATGAHSILPGTRLGESQPRDDRRHCR